jgi:hypothetical protein
LNGMRSTITKVTKDTKRESVKSSLFVNFVFFVVMPTEGFCSEYRTAEQGTAE